MRVVRGIYLSSIDRPIRERVHASSITDSRFLFFCPVLSSSEVNYSVVVLVRPRSPCLYSREQLY